MKSLLLFVFFLLSICAIISSQITSNTSFTFILLLSFLSYTPNSFLCINNFLNYLLWVFCFRNKEIWIKHLLSKRLKLIRKWIVRSYRYICVVVCRESICSLRGDSFLWILSFDLFNKFFFINSCHSIKIIFYVTFWWIEKLTSAFAHYAETKNFWFIMVNFWR